MFADNRNNLVMQAPVIFYGATSACSVISSVISLNFLSSLRSYLCLFAEISSHLNHLKPAWHIYDCYAAKQNTEFNEATDVNNTKLARAFAILPTLTSNDKNNYLAVGRCFG